MILHHLEAAPHLPTGAIVLSPSAAGGPAEPLPAGGTQGACDAYDEPPTNPVEAPPCIVVAAHPKPILLPAEQAGGRSTKAVAYSGVKLTPMAPAGCDARHPSCQRQLALGVVLGALLVIKGRALLRWVFGPRQGDDPPATPPRQASGSDFAESPPARSASRSPSWENLSS